MRLVRLVTGGACAALLISAAPSLAQPTPLESRDAIDPKSPVRMELTLCQDKDDRDCIEALGLVVRGRFTPGSLVSGGPPIIVGPVKPGGSETGPTTGRMITRNETWRIPGLQTESGQDTIDPFIAITTPGLRWYNAQADYEYDVTSQIEFEIAGRGIDVQASPPCDERTGTCTRMERIAIDQTLRVVVRTSWFQPAWARSHLSGTVLRVDPMAGGGSRITVQGEALNSPGFFFGGGRNPRPEQRDQFDYYDYRWTVYMMDANDPNFPSECSRHGFPLVSGNQWGSGTPTWDQSTQEMDLQMSAPHLDPNGKPFRGHYEAFIPGKYAECLWRADPKRLQSRLTVEVTAEDGEEKAASTSIGYRDGGVRVVARNFTFSSPTITVKPKKKR